MIIPPKSYHEFRDANSRPHTMNDTAERISEVIRHGAGTAGLIELQPVSPDAHHVEVDQSADLGQSIDVTVRHELSV